MGRAATGTGPNIALFRIAKHIAFFRFDLSRKVSCDLTVVNHLSHRVLVFEGAHIKQQSPDWQTVQNHHITW